MPRQPETVSIWWEVIKLVIPSIATAIFTGFLVARWKARADYLEKRLDNYFDDIQAVADFASDYWSIDQTAPGAIVLQARVSAGVMRLARTRVLLSQFVRGLDDPELINAEQAFLRETTGGLFGVHNRTISYERAAGAQHSASALMVAVRKCRSNTFPHRWYTARV